MNRLPSDALTKPRSKRSVVIAVLAVIGVAAISLALFAGVRAYAASAAPKPTVTRSAFADTSDLPAIPAEQSDLAVDQQQEEAAAAAAQAAAAAAAQQQAQQAAAAAAAASKQHAAASSKHPSGTPLPFVKSSDPQNANGGDYTDPGTYCESGSASTVNGVPTCD